ncbi:uncharacterized protein [Argopecten irradians]|uniref:uncharacterized protein n=1 Tax=Argopecten irradians TaxID=31199 RepID=UPI0037143AA3
MSEIEKASTLQQHCTNDVVVSAVHTDDSTTKTCDEDDITAPSLLGIDPLLIECPICLEQLDPPKSLPCLHTFCLQCLSDCITKDDNLTTFPCPICRRVTMPPDSSTEKTIWAFQFPTNNLIVEMIKCSQQPTAKKNCEPCVRRAGRETPAVRWCRICNVYLCQQCENDFHAFLHSAVETIDLTDFKKPHLKINSSSLRCSKHQKRMSLFCEDHQVLICSLCAAISHRSCFDVLTPNDYAKKLTNDDDRARLLEGELVMDAFMTDFTTQLENLERNRHEAEQKISEESQKLDTIVIQMRDQSLSELTNIYKIQKEYLETSIQRCKSLKNSMASTIKLSAAISSSEDFIQKISVKQRGKAEINSCKEVIRDLVRPFEEKIIAFETECLSEKLESLKAMGNILITNHVRELPTAVDKWLPLSERIIRHHKTINVKLEDDKQACSVRDAVWYDETIIVLTDANNKSVKMFTDNGEHVDVLHLADRPWAVCILPGSRLAVTRPDAKTISVIKVEDKTIKEPNGTDQKTRDYVTDCRGPNDHSESTDQNTCETFADCKGPNETFESTDQNTFENFADCKGPNETSEGTDQNTCEYFADCRRPKRKRTIVMSIEKDITIDRHCYGICHVGDKFVVSNGKVSPYQLYSVASDGRTDLIVEHESSSYYVCKTDNQNEVLVSLTSNITGNAGLYRGSTDGPLNRANISPGGGVDMSSGHGLDIDREGNMYLCCGARPRVVQVTSDGAQGKDLITGEDDLKDPRAVAVIQNKIVVADVAKTNANTVKIFHLR